MLIKRKSAVLSVAGKFKSLEHLKKGTSGYSLAQKYSLGTYMISNTKKLNKSTKKFVSTFFSEVWGLLRKIMKMAENRDLEYVYQAMYAWFNQMRSQG